MRKIFGILVLVMISSLFATGQRAIIIFDASGSMWGQINGVPKINIAKDALKKVVKSWNPNIELGLTVYGHRRKGDCNDIESVVPVGTVDKGRIIKSVMAISPKGKTPISRSLKRAADELKFTEDKATVILISDGKETCDLDPCGTAKELKKQGIDFVAHVIGFNVDKATDKQLQCIANATGGEYFSAKNADALNSAMKRIVKKVEVPKPKKPVVASTNGKVYVTARETEGGKLVYANCKLYNEDKSKSWVISARKKDPKEYAKKVPVGKYTLNCFYNAFERKDIPVEIKAGETTHVDVLFGQTGKVFVSASEKEGGKWINANCRIYNEEKSRDWNIYPRKDKDSSMGYKELPAGKYTLNCNYNAFEKKDIPFEIKPGKMTKVHVVFGQTGRVFVSASEKEGGKWINANCDIYDEAKDKSWVVYPRKYKSTSMSERQLPAGKYFLKCRYNNFKKEVPFEIKAKETTKVHVVFPYFYLKSKCLKPNDRVRYEIYEANGALVYDRTKPCSKKIKVTLDEGTYSIEGKVKDAKAATKIEVSSKEPQSAVLDFTKQNHEAEIQADIPTEETATMESSQKKEVKKNQENTQINIAGKKIEIKGMDQKDIKKLEQMGKALEQLGSIVKSVSGNSQEQKVKNKKADEEFEKMSKELDMFTK